MRRDSTISVVIPTYHRPDRLPRAVGSVLAQRLPAGLDLEVLISVSDRDSGVDRATAEGLAADDDRVRVVLAPRPGPSAARNAALAAATGEVIALLDDDCEAQPGWIEAGVARLQDVDLVQGKTTPGEPLTTAHDRSVWVEGISGLWESCNLFFRRSVIEKHGVFDESWNPTGQIGKHWGEDTEWGWRVVRGGTTFAYEPQAYVHHAVFSVGHRAWIEHLAKVQYFPFLVKSIPELRDAVLYRRYFLGKRHRSLAAAAVLMAAAGSSAVLGYRRTGKGLAAVAGVPLLSFHVRNIENEWVQFAALVYGSIRYRRVVL